MTHQKIFSTPCSEDKDVLKAIHMLADQVIQDFKGASCDLAVLFVSAVYCGGKFNGTQLSGRKLFDYR